MYVYVCMYVCMHVCMATMDEGHAGEPPAVFVRLLVHRRGHHRGVGDGIFHIHTYIHTYIHIIDVTNTYLDSPVEQYDPASSFPRRCLQIQGMYVCMYE